MLRFNASHRLCRKRIYPNHAIGLSTVRATIEDNQAIKLPRLGEPSCDLIIRSNRMKKCRTVILTAILALGASLARANVNCNGNGNISFGGAVGTGVLSLSDDGTNVYGTFTLSSGTFNDCLVI